MTLRRALEALLEGIYSAEHHNVFEPILTRLVIRDWDRKDMVHDFQVHLLESPDQIQDLLLAKNDQVLVRHLAKAFGRFVYEHATETSRAKLRKALDSAIRHDTRIQMAGDGLFLHSKTLAMEWPTTLWYIGSDRFDHISLRDAAVAALAQTDARDHHCALERSELVGLVCAHYHVGTTRLPLTSEDVETAATADAAEEQRRILDGDTLGYLLYKLLSADERGLLAASLDRSETRGRPNKKLETIHNKIRQWLANSRTSRNTFERTISDLKRHFLRKPERPPHSEG